MISKLVKTLKVLGQKEITVTDFAEREWGTFINEVKVEETEGSIYLNGQAIVNNTDIYNKLEGCFADDGVIIDNYTFKIDKDGISDWEINSDLDINYICQSNTITIEFDVELLEEIQDKYIKNLAQKDNISTEEKIKELFAGDKEIDWDALTYKEMDFAYKEYYSDLYNNQENTNKLFQY
ncbi:hypothetical protein HYH37_09470 [Clostridium botulinum]|uniref:hypothetical protein n=1 Tax=Clostridium botulinum TaxID=1491 RepID=UPI001C9AC4D8|nr:hypothetical protein [Clostridium botulinum]MBY6873410.1 hypothetical protein [Clostridium botulinum]